ncbi:MAG: hypothetical protein A2252_11570 [Elusimicrobia bacterium RIFOXYA2_FULL_39_19]|nr:MAG: hypothetical protein A2252_11570 [Elusimicrobia bacterium RIFOXYA2_FULL_39_19]
MFKKAALIFTLLLSSIVFVNYVYSDVLTCDSEFVLGQDTYTYTGANMTSSTGVWGPKGVFIDHVNNRAFVTDTNNSRVLIWNDLANLTNGKYADVVIGQPDFGSTAYNFGGRSAKTLYWPQGIAVDASGNLWVADTYNHRVLKFDAPFSNFQSATLRLGQGDFTSGSTWGGASMGQNNFYDPKDVAFDLQGNLLVSDYSDCRVLRFSTPFSNNMDADLVLGATDFILNTAAANKGNQNNLYSPEGITVDWSGNVWVADLGNHRAIRFDVPLSSGMNANVVIGSTGGFINYESGIARQYRFNYPSSVAVDRSSNVWIADRANHRVLRFSIPISSGMNADICIGHGEYTSGGANDSHPYCDYYAYPEHLYTPYDITVDSGNNIWVADNGNNRVLKFMTPSSQFGEAADLVLGQATLNSNAINGLNNRGLYQPYAVAVDTITDICAVTDTNNNRVLFWYGIDSFSNGKAADGVIGQPNFTSAAPQQNNAGAVDNGLYAPKGVAFDASGNMWVCDSGNNRVLKFTKPFSAANQSAVLVIGQPDMNTGTTGTTQKKLNDPRNICFDASGNLWVADASNCRAIRFDPPFATNMDAAVVLGQSLFTTNAYGGGTQNGLSYPYGVFAQSNGSIWVADTSVHRTLRYDVPISSGMNANLVLGQSNFTGIGTGLNASGTQTPQSVCVDGFGNAWVVDGYSRALRYTAPLSSGMASTKVLGQADFGSNAANRSGTPGRNTLYTPKGMVIDQDDNLWIADTYNRRIMKFNKHYFYLDVASSTPNSIYNNSVRNIQLTGNDFVQGVVVTFKKAGSSNVTATNVVVTTNAYLTCDVNLVGYATGYWDIEASYGGFYDILISSFFVDSVRLYSVWPSSGLKSVPTNISLAGVNLLAGTSVWLQRGGTQLPATNITVVCSTQIICTLTLDSAVTGYWTVYISTGNTSLSLGNGFFVSDIQTISINPATGINNRVVDCLITGEGFLTGTEVKLQKAGETDITATNIAVMGNNQISARLDLSGCATGYWDLYVSTVNSLMSSWNVHPDMFTINTILISSMTPDTADNIYPANITLFGQNLGVGTTVALTKSGQTNINGTGIVALDTQMSAVFNLTNAATGYWNVVVTSWPATYTLTNGLSVKTILVSSITPQSVNNGGVASVAVNGDNFAPGCTVTLTKSGETAIPALGTMPLSGVQLGCAFDLTSVATGYWNVIVTSGSVSYTLPNGLQVGTLIINSINPPDIGNHMPANISVIGESFVEGTILKITKSGETDINATNVTVTNPALMTGLFDLTNAATGQWNVVITSGVMTYTLPNGLLVSTNRLDTVNPSAEWNNKPVNFTITGDNILTGTLINISQQGQTDVYATNLVYVSTSEIKGTIDLSGLTTGYWNVALSTCATTATKVNGLLIKTNALANINPAAGLNSGLINVTVTGTDMAAGTVLKLTKTAQSDIYASLSAASETELTGTFDLTGAATGQWNVVITSAGMSSTLPNGFAVGTMRAVSVSPSLTLNNKTLNVTLTGENLLSGTTLAITINNQIISAAAVNVVSATELTGSFDLTGAATGYWSVVITSGNISSALVDVLQVKAINLTSISSNIEINNKTKSFTLQGDGMFAGATVKLSKTGQTDVDAANVTAGDTSLVCDVSLLNLTTGYWDITVTTGNSVATIANALLIKTMSLTSIVPSSGTAGGSLSVAINGENILEGSTVKLTKEAQTDITATAVTVSSDTQISCSINLTAAVTGYWNMVVTSAPLSAITLANAFEVKANETEAQQPIDNTKAEEVKITPPAGEVKVEIPAATFTENVKINVTVPVTASLPAVTEKTLKSIDVAVEITATRQADNTEVQPEKDITITINYRDADVAGIDESKIVITFYSDGNRWVTIPSVPDPANNRVTGTVKHFTLFRLAQAQSANDLDNVVVYPNPYKGIDSIQGEGVVFTGLTADAVISIYNIAGELVRKCDATNINGLYLWDTTNEAGNKVAGGVYVYYIKDTADSAQKAKGKFAIMR